MEEQGVLPRPRGSDGETEPIATTHVPAPRISWLEEPSGDPPHHPGTSHPTSPQPSVSPLTAQEAQCSNVLWLSPQ